MKRKIFVFVGAPASGKGTRIEECIKKGYISISTSKLLRAAGFDLTKGTLINDDDVIKLVKRELEKIDDNIILDGFPRTVNQAKSLIDNGVEIEKVIYICTPEGMLYERVSNRLTCLNCQASFTKDSFKRSKIDGVCDHCGGELVSRKDDSKELLRKRIKIFETETKKVLVLFNEVNIPIVKVDGTKPPSEILKFI